jgi:hypothetical protein
MAVIAASRYLGLLSDLKIAWPYWMVLASAASFVVCLIGSPRK